MYQSKFRSFLMIVIFILGFGQVSTGSEQVSEQTGRWSYNVASCQVVEAYKRSLERHLRELLIERRIRTSYPTGKIVVRGNKVLLILPEDSEESH
jgi:hypothetical protein